ncbi:MAG: hypothetical protein FWC74_09720 [Candidatus Bathyarchaeota archaeon]|nr:hypothetical protein [Candidatus Termitimicrobium sp.]
MKSKAVKFLMTCLVVTVLSFGISSQIHAQQNELTRDYLESLSNEQLLSYYAPFREITYKLIEKYEVSEVMGVGCLNNAMGGPIVRSAFINTILYYNLEEHKQAMTEFIFEYALPMLRFNEEISAINAITDAWIETPEHFAGFNLNSIFDFIEDSDYYVVIRAAHMIEAGIEWQDIMDKFEHEYYTSPRSAGRIETNVARTHTSSNLRVDTWANIYAWVVLGHPIYWNISSWSVTPIPPSGWVVTTNNVFSVGIWLNGTSTSFVEYNVYIEITDTRMGSTTKLSGILRDRI